MYSQFRSQYPQGSIRTEMLSKVDGLHVFRTTVAHGDVVLATATAADTDIEVAEDRAIRRALAIAGIVLENHNTSIKATLMPQMRHQFSNQQAKQLEAVPPEQLDLTNYHKYETPDRYEPDKYETPDEPSMPYEEEPPPVMRAPIASPEIAPEPVDLSDPISQIEVEMQRIGWSKEQGRDYLLRAFNKRARSQLTASEIQQFLAHLQSLATGHR